MMTVRMTSTCEHDFDSPFRDLHRVGQYYFFKEPSRHPRRSAFRCEGRRLRAAKSMGGWCRLGSGGLASCTCFRDRRRHLRWTHIGLYADEPGRPVAMTHLCRFHTRSCRPRALMGGRFARGNAACRFARSVGDEPFSGDSRKGQPVGIMTPPKFPWLLARYLSRRVDW